MAKYDYSKIDPKDFENLVADQFRGIKTTGFIILWKGQRIAPANGNADIYPSRNAAIDALERNLAVTHEAFTYLCTKEGYPKLHDDPKFVKEVIKRPDPYDSKKQITETRFTDDYFRIRNISQRTGYFLIQQWLKNGTLVIKEIK